MLSNSLLWKSLLLVVGLTFCGCSKKEQVVSVQGKLVDGDKPWVFDQSKVILPHGGKIMPPTAKGGGGGPITIALISVEGNDSFYPNFDASAGTFTVNGVKPGRYKIAIYSTLSPKDEDDPFKGKFKQDRTQIIRDIEPGKDIVIDVSKPTG